VHMTLPPQLSPCFRDSPPLFPPSPSIIIVNTGGNDLHI
jgi:hypothetical protein